MSRFILVLKFGTCITDWWMLSRGVPMGAASIFSGPLKKVSASCSISLVIVAENMRFCRLRGRRSRTRDICVRKPCSSISSTSSRISRRTAPNRSRPWSAMSRIRPGVPTTTSAPCRIRAACGCMPAPPNTPTTIMPESAASFCACCSTWRTSSRVGTRIMI